MGIIKKQMYLISGLGADQRIFKNLILEHYDLHYIKWIEPLHKETISDYAHRLSVQIKHDNICLGGLSFGGIMAQEIAGFREVERIVLFSSVKSRSELPWYFRLSAKINFHRMIPTFLLKNPNSFTFWIFGAKSEECKSLLKSFMQNSSSTYLRWAINEIVNWQGIITETAVIHFHGSNDRILPIKNISEVQIIEGGGHFMVFDRAEDVNKLLNEQL